MGIGGYECESVMFSLGASKMPLLLYYYLVFVAIGELVKCTLELVPILSMLLF